MIGYVTLGTNDLGKATAFYDSLLVARLEMLLAGEPGVTSRKMFGGICFMLNGNICVGVHKDYLIVRAGEQRAAALLERGDVRPMDVTGKPMKGWIMVGPAAIEEEADLARYVMAGLDFVATLPPK